MRFGPAFYRSLLVLAALVIILALLLVPVYYVALHSSYEHSLELVTRDITDRAERINTSVQDLMLVDYQMNTPYANETRHLRDDEFSPVSLYSILQCRKQFSELTKPIEGPAVFLWIYRGNSKMLVAGEHRDVLDFSYMLFDQYLHYAGLSATALRATLLGLTGSVAVLPATDVSFYRGTPQSYFTVVTQRSGGSAVVCALYSPEKIADFIGLSEYSEKAYVSYADAHGVPIFRVGNPETTRGEVVIQHPMSVLGGTLTVGIPYSYFSDQVSGVLHLIIRYIVCFLVIGLAVSLFIAIRNYKPISRLVEIAEPVSGTTPPARDEFTFLAEVFRYSKQDREELRQQVAVMKQSVHDSHLVQLLFGYAGKNDLNTVEQYLVELKGPCRLALIDIGYDRSEEEAEQIMLTMFPMFESRGFRMIYLGYGQLVSLFNDEQAAQFESIFETMQSAVSEQYSARANAIISEVFSEAAQLGKVFQSLQLLAVSAEHPMTYAHAAEQKKQKVQPANQGMLASAIQTGNGAAAESLIVTTLNNMVREGCGYQDVADAFESMRSAIVSTAAELNAPAEVVGFSNAIPLLVQFERLSASAAELAERQKSKTNYPSYKNEMIVYINEHFTDCDMYAGMVAEEFHVSTKQVYRVIREMTGKGFSDYLEDLRIQYASRMLDSTEERVSEVALRSGFGSVNTFYKSFKRVYGISPSVYRSRDGEKAEKTDEAPDQE